MNGGEVVAALVGLDGGSHSILSIKGGDKTPDSTGPLIQEVVFLLP